jgi:hypothetical protein
VIRRKPVPDHALHARYAREGAYIDCYATSFGAPVRHADFVFAFYTSWLFRLERQVLDVIVRKPSTDAQARELAEGERQDFAAWTVEARGTEQILMRDFLGNTRSWLMIEKHADDTRTALYFGSVVMRKRDPATGKSRMGAGFALMLPFHKLYSRALLRAARTRLARGVRSPERIRQETSDCH